MTARVPSPEIMLDRLCRVLKLRKSIFISANPFKDLPPGDYSIELLNPGPRMTRGLSLNVQAPGDGTLRIQVAAHSGVGTGQSSILYSCGRREFAEKVWTIEAGIECARALGVNVGEL